MCFDLIKINKEVAQYVILIYDDVIGKTHRIALWKN